MRSQATPSFREALAALPAEIQERARKAFKLFSDDPSHPKGGSGLPPADAATVLLDAVPTLRHLVLVVLPGEEKRTARGEVLHA